MLKKILVFIHNKCIFALTSNIWSHFTMPFYTYFKQISDYLKCNAVLLNKLQDDLCLKTDGVLYFKYVK